MFDYTSRIFNIVDAFLGNDLLQRLDRIGVGIDSSHLKPLLAQVQCIAPVGAAHVQRSARFDQLASADHFAVG